MNLVECNVWCSENDQARDLGLPDGDTWMPIAVDFDKLNAIKLAGSHDFIGDDKATLYMESGYVVIVDIKYRDAVDKWMGLDILKP